MAEIREECTKYTADYIYNIDESGYYWKIKPNRSLTTFEESGRKKDKARITVNFTYNATSTDRLPLWFIGKAHRPNCFRNERLNVTDRLRILPGSLPDPDVAHDLPLGLPIKLSFLSATCPFPFFTCVF